MDVGFGLAFGKAYSFHFCALPNKAMQPTLRHFRQLWWTSNPNNSYSSELSSFKFQNSILCGQTPMSEFSGQIPKFRTLKPSLNGNAETSRQRLRLTPRSKGRNVEVEAYSEVKPSTSRLSLNRGSNRMDGS